MAKWEIEWSADLFGTTTIEAATEEEAERKFKALREGKSLTNLPDTQTEDSWVGSGEMDVDAVTMVE
jgi:hypothetical protein